MKFFIAIALIAAVASAGVVKPTHLSNELVEIQQIVAAINSPSTDPATAAALEQMLLDVMGVAPSPVQVGPAIIETSPISVGPAIIETSPISVGPAMIDFPLPDGGVVTAEEPAAVVAPVAVVAPTPAVVAPVASESTPLVQIILNINAAASAVESSPIAVSPVVVPGTAEEIVAPIVPGPVTVVEEVYQPGPVNVVDGVDVISVEPIQVVNPVVVEPIQVVNPVIVEPVQVVEPIVVSPVIVGTPIIPAPAVVLPEELN